MKNNLCIIFGFIILFLSPHAFGEKINFSLDKPAPAFQLSTNRYKPIYEGREYQTTCYGVRTVEDPSTCTTTTEEVCTYETTATGGTTVVCATTPRESCTTHGHAETYSYECTGVMQDHVGDELVHTFKSEVTVILESNEIFRGHELSLNVNLNDDGNLEAELVSEFNEAALIAEKVVISKVVHGTVTTQKVTLLIRPRILDADIQLMSVAYISELSLGAGSIQMLIKDGAALDHALQLSLNIINDRPVLSDQVLFAGKVNENAIQQSREGNDLKLTIDLSKASVPLRGKSIKLSASVKFKDGLNILNRKPFEWALSKVLTK